MITCCPLIRTALLSIPEGRMKYEVHRMMWGNWVPTQIRSVSYDSNSDCLAIGREDGDIEIVHPQEKWFLRAKVPGKNNFKLQQLVWSTTLNEKSRLFGVSLRGFIFEVDLGKLNVTNVRDSYGGAAWCISAHAHDPILAVGCEDGVVRLFSYDNNGLEYFKSFPTVNSRVLSCAFHPTQTKLFIGCDDGIIRCFHEKTGASLFKLVGDFGRGIQTCIWSLCVLKDSTVISGDSTGKIHIWDGSVGVLLQSVQQHTAEILSIVADADENTFFASGVDSKVACFSRILHEDASSRLNNRDDQYIDPNESTISVVMSPADYQWVYGTSHRPHSHDVHTLCIIPPSSSQPSLLISGGMDCKLCTYSISDFLSARPTWILPTPSSGLISASTDFSLATMKSKTQMNIWSIVLRNRYSSQCASSGNTSAVTNKSSKRKKSKLTETEVMKYECTTSINTYTNDELQSSCQLSLRIELQGDDHIYTHSLSPNGKYLALSRADSGTKLFTIQKTTTKNTSENSVIEVLPIHLPPSISSYLCPCMCFSHDSRKMIVITTKGIIYVTEIINLEDNVPSTSTHTKKKSKKATTESESSSKSIEVRIISEINHTKAINQSNMKSSINHWNSHKYNLPSLDYLPRDMVLSADERYLAVIDSSFGIYIYDMDRMHLHWQLPRRAPHFHTFLAFNPHLSLASMLVVCYSDNTFHVYDMDTCQLHTWSQQNPTTRFPPLLLDKATTLDYGQFHPYKPYTLMLHSKGYLVVVDLMTSLPREPKLIGYPSFHTSSKSSVKSASSINKENNQITVNANEKEIEDTSAAKNKKKRNKSTASTTDIASSGLDANTSLSDTAESGKDGLVIIEKYRGLIHVALPPHTNTNTNDDNSMADLPSNMVVLENPWLRILEQLPVDPLRRKRYGT